jgi:hypothetical protein
MKYSLFIVLMFLIGCGADERNVTRSFESESYKKECNDMCQKKYHTDVNEVGFASGTYYCK